MIYGYCRQYCGEKNLHVVRLTILYCCGKGKPWLKTENEIKSEYGNNVYIPRLKDDERYQYNMKINRKIKSNIYSLAGLGKTINIKNNRKLINSELKKS